MLDGDATMEVVRDLNLKRQNQDVSWGITIADEHGRHKVQDIAENSPCKKGGLTVGDYITHINGVNLLKKSHDKTVHALVRAGNKAHLKVKSPNPIRTVIMTKEEGQSFGMGITDGTSGPYQQVSDIVVDSSAEMAGVQVGDIILAINGNSATNSYRSVVIHQLQVSGNEVELKLTVPIVHTQWLRLATTPPPPDGSADCLGIPVTRHVIARMPGKPLGVQIHALPGHAGQQIIDIEPSGPFAHAGVQVDAVLLEINGKFVLDACDHEAVVAELKASPETFEVVCATAAAVDSIREPIQKALPIKLGTPPAKTAVKPTPKVPTPKASPAKAAPLPEPATPEKAAASPEKKNNASPLMAMLGFGGENDAVPATAAEAGADAPAVGTAEATSEWTLSSLFSSSPKPKDGERRVVVDRKAGGTLGLNLSGFVDRTGAQIVGTQPGTTAALHDSKFQVGDTVVSVNGSRAFDLPFAKVLELFQATEGKELILILKTPETPPQPLESVPAAPAAPESPSRASKKTATVTVTVTVKRKAGSGLGMGVKESSSHRINTVLKGSVAEKAGIRIDDIIQSINGKKAVGASHATVINMLKTAGNTITIVVKRK